MGFVHHQTSPSQIGIRTVDVDNTCNFSTTSNLCISIFTWNMNGQVLESLDYSLRFFLTVVFALLTKFYFYLVVVSKFNSTLLFNLAWINQVSFEDLAEMVGSNRDFDLLAVGLQEAPGNKIATMLSAALNESHT